MSSAVEKHILFAGCFSPFTPPQPSCSVNRLLFLLFDAEEMTDNAFAEQRTKASFSHSTVYMYQGIVRREEPLLYLALLHLSRANNTGHCFTLNKDILTLMLW